MDCCKWTKEKPILVFSRICCFSTATAAYIVAALELILTVIVMIMDARGAASSPWLLYGHGFSNYSDYLNKFFNMDESEYPDPDYSAVVLPAIAETIPYIVHIIITAILIHGIRKNKFGWMRVWLWVRFVNMIDNVVFIISTSPFEVGRVIDVGLWVVLSVMAIIVVRSHVLRAPKDGEFTVMDEESGIA